MHLAESKWAETPIDPTLSLAEIQTGGSPVWEAILVDMQWRKSKPERLELRSLQIIDEMRPKLLRQGLLLIGVWTNFANGIAGPTQS